METGNVEAARAVESWYALRVKSNFELAVRATLDGKGYESFLPCFSQVSRWSDRNTVIEAPLFRGYLFAKFDCARRLPVLTTPGLLHLAPPGQPPMPVDERELDAIRAVIASGPPYGPHPFLKIGGRVEIIRGSMTGLEGILVQQKGAFRLVVPVTLLQRSVGVEVDRDWVRPVSGR
jgi:transcription antitermination factor NusG